MKLILCQPATERFQWELEVLLTNIRQFTEIEVILLFTEKKFTVPLYFRNKWGCSVFTFQDKRDLNLYIPSVRPWLLWQWLAQDPTREQETYFYIDSDIIFREWIDFATLPISEKTIVGSDVHTYLDYNYIIKCDRGPTIAAKMAEICGISTEQMKNVPGIGAHLILDKPKAEFWRRAYQDSNLIWRYFQTVESNIQKWTAEMWAQQWGWVRDGYQLIAPPELDFCRPTDDIAKWDQVKILHNAGVTGGGKYFFKSEWTDGPPYGADFSQIRRDKCTIKYVDAIQKVLQ